jgi:PAS domain S-box-containing protein
LGRLGRAESIRGGTDLLNGVLECSPIAMGIAGPDHRWIEVNAGLADLLGVSRAAAVGRSTVESVHPGDRATVKRLEDRLFEGHVAVRSVERRYVDGSGVVTRANVTARIVDEPATGQPVALYAIEDITARRHPGEDDRVTILVRELDRANRELTTANEAKTRFLADVAHELRTPLHSILLASELVQDSLAGQRTAGAILALCATIQSSGRHMVRLIDDLIDLSRIEGGRLELRPTPVLLSQLIADVASNFEHAAEEQGIALDIPEDVGPGPTVVADPDRLRQILTNLIGNALKFTERGGRVWIEVRATRDMTRITVRDSGFGIAPEDIERAFLPFEQVSGTAVQGAGLGLAISRSLAELHGGKLEATSVLGFGSAFTLSLPSRSRHATRRRGIGTLPPVADAVVGIPVLLVEDDETAMRLTTGVLETAGYEVHQAMSLAAAAAALREHVPALVLLDVRLGDGSGLDLIARIRADAATRHVPILALSANAMPDDIARATDAGCDDFLSKPASMRVLLARVGQLIERDRESDAVAARA